jgi:hypothetical protein
MPERLRDPRRLTVAVLAVGTLLLVALLAHALLGSGPRRYATNNALGSFTITVPAGKEICQPHQFVPAGAGRLAFPVDPSNQRPLPLAVTVEAEGRRLLGTTVVAPKAGVARLTLPPSSVDVADATICIRDRGGENLVLPAAFTNQANAAVSPGVPQPLARLRFDWYGTHDQTWLSFSGTVAQRFGRAKASFFGSWTMWLCLALALGTSAAAVATMARERE